MAPTGRPDLRTFEHEGLEFRDLDHDGLLAPFEDWRLPPAVRAADLVDRLCLEEKVGLLLHGTALADDDHLGSIGYGRAYDLVALDEVILSDHVTSMICRLSLRPDELARQNNALQSTAARGRFSIPVTLSSDPRHHFNPLIGAGVAAGGFSQWPEPLGLGAIGDAEVVRSFADIVRADYRAVGLHVSLGPQADLGTEPRWPRFAGTFGADPQLVRSLVEAYVEGAQAGRGGIGPSSIGVVVKHWVGYGASRDGFDGHNYYGRFSAFPAGRFQDHVDAFVGGFEAKVAGVMPTYNILDGLTIDGEPLEQVGAGFSAQLLDGLLRTTHGFAGLVLSDWAITADATASCLTGSPPQGPDEIAMPWGVEHLTRVERMAKGITAGLDQFGGEMDPAPLLEAVSLGLIDERRVTESASRVLELKFALGLFEHPFVDPERAISTVARPSSHEAAHQAQCGSLVRIDESVGPVVADDDVVLLAGVDPVAFADRGIRTTDDPSRATVAVVRLSTPFETLHPTFFFGSFMHEGDLDFTADHPGLRTVAALSSTLRTIVIVSMDRPAIVTNLRPLSTALFAEFGVSDAALVDRLVDGSPQCALLPFELPDSMAAVLRHPCDLPGGFIASTSSIHPDPGQPNTAHPEEG